MLILSDNLDPFCLLHVLFKFFSKSQTMQISPYMNKLISLCQNAFIEGRNGMDGAMSVHETSH